MSPLLKFLSAQQMTYDLSSAFVPQINMKSGGGGVGVGGGQEEK